MNALIEWLGSGGKPVERRQAEARAAVCEGCPLNRVGWGKWWETAKSYVADDIRKMLELKHRAKLELPNERGLFMCQACGCLTRLKCWTPLEHIVNHTPSATLAKFPPQCWIPKEMGMNPPSHL